MDDSVIPEEWKELWNPRKLEEVDIDTINEQWMEHPKREGFIDWKDDSIEDGMTMLLCAIKYERWDIAKLLLEHGADVHIADKNGWTALMHATLGGHAKTVELLLDKGADFTIADRSRNTALMLACRNGRDEIGKLLLDKGADVTVVGRDGMNALMKASHEGHAGLVELMVDKGADVNIVDKDGKNALMYASRRGHTKIVKFLMENGADIKTASKDGKTALMEASREGRADTVKLLSDKGADIAVVDKWGSTALSLASDKGHTKIVELLLAKVAADPNMRNSNGQTLLHLACLHDKKASAQQVLKLGTDKDMLDGNDHTALYYAAEKGFADIVELLMKQNADANKTDERTLMEATNNFGIFFTFNSVKDGRTPLFIAAQNGHRNVVLILLQHGADPYLCDSESHIPRDVSGAYSRVQQLFRIHDFFDQREQGDAYKTQYITCKRNIFQSKMKKEPISPLEDIIHDIVKYAYFADKFLELFRENREIVHWLDRDGRKVRSVACKECREAILFMGQYYLDD